jgi:hypothetical protein
VNNFHTSAFPPFKTRAPGRRIQSIGSQISPRDAATCQQLAVGMPLAPPATRITHTIAHILAVRNNCTTWPLHIKKPSSDDVMSKVLKASASSERETQDALAQRIFSTYVPDIKPQSTSSIVVTRSSRSPPFAVSAPSSSPQSDQISLQVLATPKKTAIERLATFGTAHTGFIKHFLKQVLVK